VARKLLFKGSRQLKYRGIVTIEARELARDLVSHYWVPIEQVDNVIHAVSLFVGVTIKDHLSTRSVARFITEAGVAAALQIGDYMEKAKSILPVLVRQTNEKFEF
jgi:hypothetical protein